MSPEELRLACLKLALERGPAEAVSLAATYYAFASGEVKAEVVVKFARVECPDGRARWLPLAPAINPPFKDASGNPVSIRSCIHTGDLPVVNRDGWKHA